MANNFRDYGLISVFKKERKARKISTVKVVQLVMLQRWLGSVMMSKNWQKIRESGKIIR